MSRPLKDKLVFLEIFNEMDNISYAFYPLVTSLGGLVASKFTKKVQFLVWKRGRERVWRKACKYEIPIVTPLWLDACDGEPQLADPLRYAPPEPCFDILGKRPRKAFTSPTKKLPTAKRSRPTQTAKKKNEISPSLSAIKTKIDFADTSASDSEPLRKVFLCGESGSEIDANLRLLQAKSTKKPATAELALVLDPDAVEEIAAAMLCHLPIVSSTWLKEGSEQLSWPDPLLYLAPQYHLQPTLFSAYRFGLSEDLEQGLAGRLLAAGGGSIATHPRLGDYFVCDDTPPKLPSHIKIVTTEWVARCMAEGHFIKGGQETKSNS